MNISRYLTEDAIKLEMTTALQPPPENGSVEKWRLKNTEMILSELVDLLAGTSRVGNQTKLLIDFFNREKKASTAIGHGIALPHIRSLQAKDFMIAFARSSEGYDFGAPDGQPVHMFFTMAAPPYDDNLYLKVFRSLAELLRYESLRGELMTVSSPGEIIRAIRSME
jgi:mannitol/fructose-specific phosphotransferase system IIA component (Ntr-type)